MIKNKKSLGPGKMMTLNSRSKKNNNNKIYGNNEFKENGRKFCHIGKTEKHRKVFLGSPTKRDVAFSLSLTLANHGCL